MPFYPFQSKDGEIKYIFQHMLEEHIYEENGEKWTRLFEVPNTSIDTKIDAFSSKEFVEKTKSKKGMTMGDAFDESERLSKIREKKMGYDPIKEKTINDYKKKTKGKRHPNSNS